MFSQGSIFGMTIDMNATLEEMFNTPYYGKGEVSKISWKEIFWVLSLFRVEKNRILKKMVSPMRCYFILFIVCRMERFYCTLFQF